MISNVSVLRDEALTGTGVQLFLTPFLYRFGLGSVISAKIE